MCVGGKDLWSGNVEPSNAVGHFGGNASREGCYLLMDVREKGVRGPASLFADGIMWDAIEVHCHGAASMEGVTADAGGWETLFVKATTAAFSMQLMSPDCRHQRSLLWGE